MTPALAVVPPMSKAMAFFRPIRSHSIFEPMTPAAGPDSSMRMQDSCASSMSNRTPEDCTPRPVQETLRLRLSGAGLLDAGLDAGHQPLTRGQRLAEQLLAGRLIDRGDIGEC